MTALEVEVAFALPDRQLLLEVSLPAGSTVADAIRCSAIQARVGEQDLEAMAVGIWGRRVSRDQLVRNGDRVEIYRPLEIDPREARRQRAALGETMRRSDSD